MLVVEAPCNCSYFCGGQNWAPTHFSEPISQFRNTVARLVGVHPLVLNSLNCNKYETSDQDIAWHSDNEALFRRSESQRNTFIVSVSFGAQRKFAFRKKLNGGAFHEILLNDADLMTMEGLFQDDFEHALLPGDSSQHAFASSSGTDAHVRYNFTFRQLVRHNRRCVMKRVALKKVPN